MGGVKGKLIILFNKSTNNDHNKPTRITNLHYSEKKSKKIKIQIWRQYNLRHKKLFEQKNKNWSIQKSIILDIENLFEKEKEDYYKPE